MYSSFKVFVCLICLASASVKASLLEELTAENTAALNSGEPVIVTTEMPNAIWPNIRIYKKINASPKTITDLFLDYPSANTFIPNLKSAVVEKNLDQSTADVRYTVKLPVIPTIDYLVRNHYEHSGEYSKVSWNLLEPPFAAKSAEGSLRVEPLTGPSTSILCYENHVEPSTRLIASLKNLAVNEAKNTVLSISKESERREKKK